MNKHQPKKILVAMDASTLSYAAWEYACGLARKLGASVEAVYVREGAPLLVPELYVPKDDRDELAGTLSALRARLGRGAALHLTGGQPAEEIVRLAKRLKADLIVMGTHGRRGLARALLGSVAEGVLRVSGIPVLVVPPAKPGPDRISRQEKMLRSFVTP